MANKSTAKPARGFTLLEVMIVVAIVGIIAALAVPEFTGVLRRTRARAQHANVGKHLRDARNTARATLCPQKVTVDASANTISYGPVATTGTCGSLNTFVRRIDSDLVSLEEPMVGATLTNPVEFNVTGGTDYVQDFTIKATANVPAVKDATFHVWPLVGTVEKL